MEMIRRPTSRRYDDARAAELLDDVAGVLVRACDAVGPSTAAAAAERARD